MSRAPATPSRRSPATWLLGAGAALVWALACVRWFDDGAAFRPAWLQALPPWLLLGATLAAGLAWLWQERAAIGGDGLDPDGYVGLYAVSALALLARLPLVWSAAAAYVTSDGALSGIVALRVRDAREHFVFVPAVPYSGSLKSHLAAPLAALIDPARAFALVSVLFFVLAVAAVYRLAWRAGGRGAALGAALYLALAPAFVTQYSLSNDGNYVEVLALGPWALLLALRARETPRPGPPVLAAGVLLGLAFWCHILALIPALTVGLVVLAGLRRRGLRAALALAAGFVAGYLPGLLWNAGHGWESLRYVIPGLQPVGEGERFGLGARLFGLLFDHAPILMGDSGAETLDTLVRALAWIAVAAGAGALVFALRAAWRLRRAEPVASRALGAVLLLAAVNVAVVLFALPYLPGNPRYLVFLATPVVVALGFAATRVRGGRLALALLIAFGMPGTLDQARLKLAADRDWRALVHGLEQAGVRHCYSDFYLGTKITFLSEERVICSAKLGPTTTEYFFEYRREVDDAPAAAYVATTWAQGDKLGRRLARLGVGYERLALMKPVLLPARKVDPQELFPERTFPLR